MNVVIIIDTPGRGGAERVALTLARWLEVQNGIHSTIIAIRESSKMTYPTDGIDFVNLKNRNVICGIRRIVTEKRADIVLTMTVPLCIYTVPALLGLKTKHVVSERNSPAHFSGKWITKVLSRWLMKQAEGFVFQTKQARDFYDGIIANRSAVIHNPICELSEGAKSPMSQRRKEIVSVGRLNKQKNHALLIRAFADVLKDYPEYTLIIYGDGRERENLESLINCLGISGKVILAGTQCNVHKEIANAAMFVMSSDFEGMPNALMEAMALGLPCISTDCPSGGPADLISDGKNGLLVPVKDKNPLVNAIIELIEKRDYALELGKEASNIRETHSSDVICGQWLAFFRSIIAK